jgi:hypothetical protein
VFEHTELAHFRAMPPGHDVQCFPNVCLLNSDENPPAHSCFQLKILSAKPGVVKASLTIEPYNREFFLITRSQVLLTGFADK